MTEEGDKLHNAVLKFALLINDHPDKEDIELIKEELQDDVYPETLDRIIELADKLEDDTSEDDTEETDEENKLNDDEE